MRHLYLWGGCFLLGLYLLAAVARAQTGSPPAPAFAAPWLSFNTTASSTGGSAFAIATGDFDGDGDRDVVCAQQYLVGGFAFLRNDGTGRFAPPVGYPGGNRAAGIVAVDLNGDQKLDVAVTNSDTTSLGTTVSVNLGNGDGTFGARQVTSLGSGRVVPIGITAADFDGDGDNDLAVAVYGAIGTGRVAVLKNNGNGTFAAPVNIATDDSPFDIASGDLNGDGKPDLVVAHNEYTVTVLLNNGSGGFAAPVAYRSLTSDNWAGPFYGCIALGDVNGDGKLDVLYGSTRTWDGYTGHIVQLRNDGTGALTRAANIPLVLYSAGPSDLFVADMNGDGALDILAAHHSGRASDGVCVIMNNGGGNFAAPVLYPGGQGTMAIVAADVNKDSKLDILTADDYSSAVTVRLNPGNGNFATVPYDFAGSIQSGQDAADIDGDGDQDIFTSGPHSSADDGAIMRNNGSGRFSRTPIYNGDDGVSSGVLRDLNGDHKPDLLWVSANTAPVYDVFTAMNNGDGTFGPNTRWPAHSAGWGNCDAFDIDNDGDLDVIALEALGAPGIGGGRFFILRNNGNGTFQPATIYDQLPRRPDDLEGADFNHDGKLDLALTNNGAYGFDDSVYIVLGNGDGTFQPPIVYTAGRGPANLVMGDWDKDGELDLASLNSGFDNEGAESLTLLFGVGNGTFNRLHTQYVPYSPDLLGATGITAGDIDGDGDLDLLATGVANEVILYVNDGAGNFTMPYRMGVLAGTVAPIYRDFSGDGVPDLAVLSTPPPLGFDGGVAIMLGLTSPKPRVSSMQRSGDDVVINFQAVANRTHRLQRKDTLETGDWLNLVEMTPSTAGEMQFTHPGGFKAPKNFYRVVVLP